MSSSATEVPEYYPNGTRFEPITAEIGLPDGTSINQFSRMVQVSRQGTIWKHEPSASNFSLPGAFDDASKNIFRSSIFNASIIAFTNNGCGTPLNDIGIERANHYRLVHTSCPYQQESLNIVAATCSFYPCVLDYHGTVRNTIFTEKIVRDTPILQDQGQESKTFPSFVQFRTPCLIDGQEYTLDNVSSIPRNERNFTSRYIADRNVTYPTDCAYGVYGVYALSLINFMSDTLIENCTPPSRITFSGGPDDYNSLDCSPWYLKSLVNKGNASFESIDHNMQSIASAITSEMRKQGGDLFNENEQIYAVGDTLRTTVCTEFDWIWLSFPLGLIVSTALLLGIICSKMLLDTEQVPAWKSSILPLLFTGDQIASAVDAGEISEIHSAGKKVTVQLSHKQNGWQFVSKDCQDED